LAYPGYPVQPYVTKSLCRHLYQLRSTGSILSILAYPEYGYHLVYHRSLSLVHLSYQSVGSLHNVPGGGQHGQAFRGAADPNVPAAGQLGQAPRGVSGPNVQAAQVNVPSAGQLRQAPPYAAVPNVAAARPLEQAPPGAPGPNVPAGQVNVTAR